VDKIRQLASSASDSPFFLAVRIELTITPVLHCGIILLESWTMSQFLVAAGSCVPLAPHLSVTADNGLGPPRSPPHIVGRLPQATPPAHCTSKILRFVSH
jgi:hypothetical protein